MTNVWPDLPFAPWSETCETLHRWAQIVDAARQSLVEYSPLCHGTRADHVAHVA
jgi:hypothetical protein